MPFSLRASDVQATISPTFGCMLDVTTETCTAERVYVDTQRFQLGAALVDKLYAQLGQIRTARRELECSPPSNVDSTNEPG